VCDLDLALQALVLDALGEQRLDVGGHVVEAEREFAQLVARARAYAMREVAALDGLGGAVELVDGARHGARHPRGGEEREQFEDDERDGDEDEHAPHRPPHHGVVPELLAGLVPRPVDGERPEWLVPAREPVGRL
jgi:hypothetical protein